MKIDINKRNINKMTEFETKILGYLSDLDAKNTKYFNNMHASQVEIVNNQKKLASRMDELAEFFNKVSNAVIETSNNQKKSASNMYESQVGIVKNQGILANKMQELTKASEIKEFEKKQAEMQEELNNISQALDSITKNDYITKCARKAITQSMKTTSTSMYNKAFINELSDIMKILNIVDDNLTETNKDISSIKSDTGRIHNISGCRL